jgi:hypothetical protein
MANQIVLSYQTDQQQEQEEAMKVDQKKWY